MKESIKQLRLDQTREFNKFCDKILTHDGSYSKPVIRQLQYYRKLFTAISGNDEFRELASENLHRLVVIQLHIDTKNEEQCFRSTKTVTKRPHSCPKKNQ